MAAERYARNCRYARRRWEKNQTMRLLEKASVLGMAQEGRDEELLVMAKMVLWKLPNACKNLAILPQGPWVAERVVGVTSMGSDRSAKATAVATIETFEEAAYTAAGHANVKKEHAFFRSRQRCSGGGRGGCVEARE